jgi:two-component system sensor histidine kinase YesM
MFKNLSLRKKFFIIFLLLITLPTVLFSFFIYIKVTDIIKEQAENDTLEQLQKMEQQLTDILLDVEVMTSYIIYNQDFQTFFAASGDKLFEKDYKDAVEHINGYFTFQLSSNHYITSIYLRGKEGNALLFGEPIHGNEQIAMKEAKKGKGKPIWSGPYLVSSEWEKREKEVLCLSRIINNYSQINEQIGMVIVSLDVDELLRNFKINQGDYFILSSNGNVVFHSDSLLMGKKYPDPALTEQVVQGKITSFDYEINHTDYIVVKKRIQGTNWYSVVLVKEKSVVKQLHSLLMMMMMMFVLLFVLGIIALILFYRSIIKRIEKLTARTIEVEKGNFTARVAVTSMDEIGKLENRFNKMVTTIQDYIEREYKLTIKEKEFQLIALQSQIDPHFLYNTLDMIRWNARLENAIQTGNLIELLSKTFRMNLSIKKKWITLEEEIQYIQAYLELQKARLGDFLEYFIYIDPQIKKTFILKQLIQPLVENSIKHGFQGIDHKGVITIRCYEEIENIFIDVIDNGRGFNLENWKQKRGHALDNLRDRILLAFGEGYGLEKLESDEGAAVRLRLPKIDEAKLEEIKKKLGE